MPRAASLCPWSLSAEKLPERQQEHLEEETMTLKSMLLGGLSLLTLTAPALATDTVRISGWGGGEVAIVNGLITDVLAEDLKAADINVVYEPVDGDFSQFIINALSAGTAPDLFYTD